MEKFINKKKKQYIGYMILFIVLIIVAHISLYLTDFAKIIVSKTWNSNPIFTPCILWSILSLVYSLRAKKLLKNEEKLKKAYIKETDERTLLIDKNATSLTCYISIIFLCIATVIFGFIDEKIYNVLLIVAIIEALILLLCILISKKKY